MLGFLRKINRNVLLFYTSKVFQLIFPLMTTVFLVRKISKSEFGSIIVCQSLSLIGSSVIEYGFNYLGPRKISEVREDPEIRSNVFKIINSAKLFLAIPSLVVISIGLCVSNIPFSFWLGTFLLSIAQGFNLLWYFQGIDRVLFAVVFDIMSKMALLIFVFSFNISGSQYMFIYGFLSILSVYALYIIKIRHENVANQINFGDIKNILNEGKSLFYFRVGSILYGGAVNALIGTHFSPVYVSVYGGADRLYKAASGLTSPIGDAYYANLSKAITEKSDQKDYLFKRAANSIITVGFLILIFGEIFAGFIVDKVLGSMYHDSIIILRILLFAVPFVCTGTIIFVLYLLPRKIDGAFAIATLIAGVWTSLFALFIAPHLGLEAMAWAVVAAEIIVNVYGLNEIRRYRRNNG